MQLRTLFIIILLFFSTAVYCHAEERTIEGVVKENEELKREIAKLKQLLSASSNNRVKPLEDSSKTTIAEIKNSEYTKGLPQEYLTSADNTISNDDQSRSEILQVAENSEEDSKEAKNDELEEDIEEIVVTATRTEQSIKDVGSSITVIPQEQIENSKSQLVQDVLRQVPGIEVTRTQGLGGTTSIFMRGAESNHTLVFVDGVEVRSTTSGGFNFANLTTDNIEKIEILRGPQSTLYGSDAIGGVINIITKKGEGPTKVTLNSEYGEHETYKEVLSISGGKESMDFAASVSYIKTHGIDFSDGVPDGREEDGYENFTGSARIGRNFMGDGRVDTTLRVSHSDLEFDDFVSFAEGSIDDLDRRQKTEEIFFSAKAKKSFFDGLWIPSLLVSVYDLEITGNDFDFESELPSGVSLNSDSFRIPTRLWKAEHQSDINLFDIITLTGGYELEVEEGENDGSISKQTIYNHAYYFQYQIELFEALNWTAGLREDRHSEFGNNLTYRSSLSYNIENLGLRFHGSWGKGYRAPSINELFFPGFGNPDLNPEESKGWDIGIEKEIIRDKLSIDVTYFENDFTDLISFTILPDGTFGAKNIGAAEAEGFETTLTYNPFNWFSIIGTHTHNDTTDKDAGDQLPRRPRQKSTVTINAQPFERLNINSSWNMVRDRIDSNGTELDDYWTLNMVMRYQFSKLITAYVRSENIFDYDYEEVAGFNTLGRTVYVGMDLTF